jgi:predicted metalloprotease with PDZ domain
MSVVIFVFLAAPQVFGFQNFVQWGGMYDDRWCTVHQYDKNPHTSTDARMSTVVPGSEMLRVYSAPTHNRQTCLARSRMYCGKTTKEGWPIVWVEPEFQGVTYMGDANVCDINDPSLDYWFYDAQ